MKCNPSEFIKILMNSEGETTVFPGPEDDRFPWAAQVAVAVAVAVSVAVLVVVAVAVAVSSNVVRPKKGAERTTR